MKYDTKEIIDGPCMKSKFSYMTLASNPRNHRWKTQEKQEFTLKKVYDPCMRSKKKYLLFPKKRFYFRFFIAISLFFELHCLHQYLARHSVQHFSHDWEAGDETDENYSKIEKYPIPFGKDLFGMNAFHNQHISLNSQSKS